MKTFRRDHMFALALLTAAALAGLLVATDAPGAPPAKIVATDLRPIPVVVLAGGGTLVLPLVR